jgi:hypothetical protein
MNDEARGLTRTRERVALLPGGGGAYGELTSLLRASAHDTFAAGAVNAPRGWAQSGYKYLVLLKVLVNGD